MESVNWNWVIVILLAVLSALSVVIGWVKKKYPGLDPYFQGGAIILAEVDDILDAILLEFHENKVLNTVEDVVEKVLKELKEAGYSVSPEDTAKITNLVKANIEKKEGAGVHWEDGKLVLEYNKKF